MPEEQIWRDVVWSDVQPKLIDEALRQSERRFDAFIDAYEHNVRRGTNIFRISITLIVILIGAYLSDTVNIELKRAALGALVPLILAVGLLHRTIFPQRLYFAADDPRVWVEDLKRNNEAQSKGEIIINNGIKIERNKKLLRKITRDIRYAVVAFAVTQSLVFWPVYL